MNDSFLNSANAPYVAELFFKFKEDPNSIDKSWSNFFKTFHEDDLAILSEAINFGLNAGKSAD